MNVREIKAWALKNGVEVRLPDGTSFNSEGLKVVPKAAAAPAPTPAKEPTSQPPILLQPKVEVTVGGLEKLIKLLEMRDEAEEGGEEKEEGWQKMTMRVTERDAGGNIREMEIWRVK